MSWFIDRVDAGRQLGQRLKENLQEGLDAVVLGIPTGGIVVGLEVAKCLDCSLVPIVSRRIKLFENDDVASGYVGMDEQAFGFDEQHWNLLASLPAFRKKIEDSKNEVRRRKEVFNISESKLRQEITGRDVVLVDDGVATAATVLGCLAYLRQTDVGSLIIAAPVIHPEAAQRVGESYDITLFSFGWMEGVGTVGNHFIDWGDVSDEEVVRLLNVRR